MFGNGRHEEGAFARLKRRSQGREGGALLRVEGLLQRSTPVRLGSRLFGDQIFGVIHFCLEILNKVVGAGPPVLKEGDEHHRENQEQGDPE